MGSPSPDPRPGRHPAAFPVAAALALVLAACKAGPTGDAASAAVAEDGATGPQPVVLGPAEGGAPVDEGRARRRVTEDEAFFREKWQAANDLAASGDDETALDVIAQAIALKPKGAWEERLRSLRSWIHARHVSTEVLRLDARGEKDYVEFDADVDFLIRLRNVGTSDLTMAAPEGEGERATSGSTLFLTVTRRDRDVYAATLVRSWKQAVPMFRPGDPPIVIGPGRSHEVRVRIPGEDAGGAISGVRTIEVSGELRADRIEAGIVLPFGRMEIRPGRVVALPRNFEPLAADPVGSMRKAATLDMPVHLLVAAEFVDPRDRPLAMTTLAETLATGPEELRPAAVNAIRTVRAAAKGTPLPPLAEPLVSALSVHPERATALMEGLSALTGVFLAPDARLWEDWWRRLARGAAASAVTAEEEDVRKPAGSRATGPPPR